MSPEHAMSVSEATPAADVRSAAVMLYEALTKQLWFDDPTPQAVLVAACTKQHRPLADAMPGVDPDLSASCSAMLSRERNCPARAQEPLVNLLAGR